MKESTKQQLLAEWIIIKRWGIPVLGMIASAVMPVFGFWIALIGYIVSYPLWKHEPNQYHNLKIFASLGLVLSFITMMALIYLITTGTLDESVVASLIAHIIKN
jgi:hypothetical protein